MSILERLSRMLGRDHRESRPAVCLDHPSLGRREGTAEKKRNHSVRFSAGRARHSTRWATASVDLGAGWAIRLLQCGASSAL